MPIATKDDYIKERKKVKRRKFAVKPKTTHQQRPLLRQHLNLLRVQKEWQGSIESQANSDEGDVENGEIWNWKRQDQGGGVRRAMASLERCLGLWLCLRLKVMLASSSN